MYGHSVPVDLNYKPSTPPDYLYHGTAESNYNSIIEKGVISKNRQFVHLSEDIETAIKVGERHGEPVVLKIATGEMLKKMIVLSIIQNSSTPAEVETNISSPIQGYQCPVKLFLNSEWYLTQASKDETGRSIISRT